MAFASSLGSSFAQGARPAEQPAVKVTQLMDVSPSQQALSRDYATGFRLAFAELKATTGLNVQLKALEVGESDAEVQAALKAVGEDSAQAALVGSVGERLALASLAHAESSRLEIAHVAPWLADSRFDANPNLFALFASREDQIRHVLKNLATMGVAKIGIVYPSAGHARALQPGMAQIAERLKLEAQVLTAPQGARPRILRRPVARQHAVLPAVHGRCHRAGTVHARPRPTGRAAHRGVPVRCRHQHLPAAEPRQGRTHHLHARGARPAHQQDRDRAVTATRCSATSTRSPRRPASPATSAGAMPVPSSRARAPSRGARSCWPICCRAAVELDGWRFDYAGGSRASNQVSQILLNSSGNFVG